MRKAEVLKRKNDEEIEEYWVMCDGCEGWVHQICGLFNKGRNNANTTYLCPDCLGRVGWRLGGRERGPGQRGEGERALPWLGAPRGRLSTRRTPKPPFSAAAGLPRAHVLQRHRHQRQAAAEQQEQHVLDAVQVAEPLHRLKRHPRLRVCVLRGGGAGR